MIYLYCRCEDIVSQFHELYGRQGFSTTKTQLVLNTEARIQGIITDVNSRLIKVLHLKAYKRRGLKHQDVKIKKLGVKIIRLLFVLF